MMILTRILATKNLMVSKRASGLLTLLCIVLAFSFNRTSAQTAGGNQDFYLFTSFRGNGGTGMYLAYSSDGYQWTPLNNNQPVLNSTIDGRGTMRDPCIIQGPDGTFHLVWTGGSTGAAKSFGYASSKDLINWSAQRRIIVMQDEPQTRNVWAPELFYDTEKQRFLILWSSTIPGKFPETDAQGDDGFNHRIYYTTTTDFVTFARSKPFFDPGFNVIDATILKVGTKHYLFYKDERKNPFKKHLRYAVADKPEGPYRSFPGVLTGEWTEGPSAIKIRDEYIVYFDRYHRPQHYGAVRSKDLKNWEDATGRMKFPVDHRHGSVIKISHGAMRKLMQREREAGVGANTGGRTGIN